MSTTSIITRRSRRRHPTPNPTPPPPSPKILHFPRTLRRRRRTTTRKQPTTTTTNNNNPLLPMHQNYYSSHKGKLFDTENNEHPLVLLNSDPQKIQSFLEKRERVEEEYNNGGGFHFELELEEEKWRFQAEILRAECNFLRIQREFALKKLERNKLKMEKALRSAVQTLLSGRNKIVEGNKNVDSVLEEEIQDLAQKLVELHNNSLSKDYRVRNCSNFDKKACVLQRRLEKLGESSLSINPTRDVDKDSTIVSYKSNDNQMDGLSSKGILDRVEEEYGSMLSSITTTTANTSSVASSASTSKRIDHLSDLSATQFYQDQMLHEENKCSGRCKVIIRRVVEQVRAETEQWSQMQEMLGQVRGEMEELQVSRDLWESRAHNSEYENQSLRQAVEEWKDKALSHEIKANELQLELTAVKEALHQVKENSTPGKNGDAMPISNSPLAPLAEQIQKEMLASSCRYKEHHHFDANERDFEKAMEELNIEENKHRAPTKDLPPVSLGNQLAKEKKMFLRRVKENRRASDKGDVREFPIHGRRKPYPNTSGVVARNREPLLDIGNSSPSARVSDKEAFTFHSPESFRIRECLRK